MPNIIVACSSAGVAALVALSGGFAALCLSQLKGPHKYQRRQFERQVTRRRSSVSREDANNRLQVQPLEQAMDQIVRQRRSESAWREIAARQEQSGVNDSGVLASARV